MLPTKPPWGVGKVAVWGGKVGVFHTFHRGKQLRCPGRFGPPNCPFERLGGIWAHFGLFKRLMAHVKDLQVLHVFLPNPMAVAPFLTKLLIILIGQNVHFFHTRCV